MTNDEDLDLDLRDISIANPCLDMVLRLIVFCTGGYLVYTGICHILIITQNY